MFQSKGYCSMYSGDWECFIRRGKSLHSLINKLLLAAVKFRLFQLARKRVWDIVADIEDDVKKKLLG